MTFFAVCLIKLSERFNFFFFNYRSLNILLWRVIISSRPGKSHRLGAKRRQSPGWARPILNLHGPWASLFNPSSIKTSTKHRLGAIRKIEHLVWSVIWFWIKYLVYWCNVTRYFDCICILIIYTFYWLLLAFVCVEVLRVVGVMRVCEIITTNELVR